MLFKLHTHFCVNNSFSSSKSLRKQVRKSADVWAESRALGSLRWDPAWQREPQSPSESQDGPGGPGDTCSAIKGFLGTPAFAQQEGVPFTEQTWPLMSDQKFWLQPGVGLKSSSQCLQSQRSLIFKICSLVYQTAPSPFPHWELFLKIHEIKKKNLNPHYFSLEHQS